MLHVDHAHWGQSPEDLRRLALGAPHARTRERFLALYEITQDRSAAAVASETKRHHQTVIQWVHDYNTHGPDALVFIHTGGLPSLSARRSDASTRRFARPSPSRPHRQQ